MNFSLLTKGLVTTINFLVSQLIMSLRQNMQKIFLRIILVCHQ